MQHTFPVQHKTRKNKNRWTSGRDIIWYYTHCASLCIIIMLSMKALNYGTQFKFISLIVHYLLSGILVIYFIIIICIVIIIIIIIIYIFFLYLCNITGCHQPHALRFWWHPHLWLNIIILSILIIKCDEMKPNKLNLNLIANDRVTFKVAKPVSLPSHAKT